MIRVGKAELEKRFSDERRSDYLSVGKVVGDVIDFEDSIWLTLAQKHGPAGCGYSVTSKRIGLGDKVERLVKPIARALKLDCLDKDGQLKKESGCAKRREKLNKFEKRLRG